MHSFVRNLITEWRRLELAFVGETVIVAVSGGADSVSLLLAVKDLVERQKLGHRIVAAHFNHALRGAESDGDEEFVRELSTSMGIGLAVARGDIADSGNLEQNAREARYEFLRQTAVNLSAFAVLTGHTVNDQAETFLLNLIRGSGPEGLRAMSAVRALEEETRRRGEEGQEGVFSDESPLLPFSSSPPLLIRPLLRWARRGDTEEYCRDSGVEYRYDTMNEDTAFKRVRIRKILLPLLEDFNPKIVETLANTAALMQKPWENRSTGNQIEPSDELILADLKSAPSGELYELIRSWLRRRRGTTRRLQLKHIEAIHRLIFSRKSGRVAELPGGRVTKTGGRLIYDENKVEN